MRVLVSPKGLVLDANAVAPPEGAMRTAEHVVVDQPGIVRARPTSTIVTSAATAYRPRAMRIFDGSVVTIAESAPNFRLDVDGVALTGNAAPPSQAQIPRFSEGRESLYYTSNTGIRKLAATTDTSSTVAGVPAFVGPLMPGTIGVDGALGSVMVGGPLPGTPLEGRLYLHDAVLENDVLEWYKTRGSTNYVVYLVVRRTDINGYVRRSPPTRIFVDAPSALPEADAYLWQTHTVTASDIAAGYVLTSRVISIVGVGLAEVYVSDTINDDLLGAALYTNPGQEGTLGAKYEPPLATEIAQSQGCMWFGNTVLPHRLLATVNVVAGSTNVVDVDVSDANGLLGAISTAPILSGTTTSGSAVVVGVPDDIEMLLRPGMYITDASNSSPASAGTAFQAETLVVSWAPGGAGLIDITVSKTATANGLRDIYVGDVVAVGGRNFYGWAQDLTWSPATGQGGRRVFGVGNTTVAQRAAVTADQLARAVNYEAIFDSTFLVRATVLGEPFVSADGQLPATILFEELGVGGAAFTLTCSSGPAIPSGTSDNAAEVGRLWFSQPEEPEAVPLTNFLRVGEAGAPILALSPLRSSLLVWKRDGLFRVTGTFPNWRVDPIDRQLRLINSGSVDVVDGTAFAWTEAGVVRATETGVSPVSGAIADHLQAAQEIVLDDELYHSWIVCWRSQGLVMLGIQAEGDGAGEVLALSTVTGAWTKFWVRGAEQIPCATYDETGSRFYWARANAWEVRRFASTCTGRDASFALGASVACTTPFTTVTVATADVGAWLPSVGDWVERTSGGTTTRARITSVATGGGNYTLTLATALAATGGGVTWAGVEGLRCVLEWQGTNPVGIWQQVREIHAYLDGETPEVGDQVLYLAQGGSSQWAQNAMVSATVPVPPAWAANPYRYGIPRSVGHNTVFYPRIEINAQNTGWRLHGLAVVGNAVSERTVR